VSLSGPVKRLFVQPLKKRNYLHGCWIANWQITFRCNLKCKYCAVIQETEDADAWAVLPKVLEMRPRHLTLTGGEPMLVEGIDQMVLELRRKINPFIVLNTNLTAHVDRVIEMLPHVDVLHFSYDGPGEIGRSHRGVSGDRVLDNLRRVIRETSSRGQKRPSLLALCVITRENYQQVDAILEPIEATGADVLVNFGTVEPYWHELSIVPHPEKVADFHRRIEPWKQRMRVAVHGVLADPPGWASVRGGTSGGAGMDCYRQFFRAQILPDGTVLTCKPGTYLGYYKQLLNLARQERRWAEMARLARELWHTLVTSPTCPYCPFPCKCEEYVDDIFQCRDGDAPPSEICDLQGRFKKEELDRMDEFLSRRLGHPLSGEVRRILLEP